MSVKLNLSDTQDGYGFFYGQALLGDFMCHVNILPPADLCRGFRLIDGYVPDEKAWIVYANGEEIARVSSLDQVEVSLQTLLPLE